MHKCIVFTVNENFSGKTHFFDINIIKNSYNSFFLLPCTEKNFSPLYISWKSFFFEIKEHTMHKQKSFSFSDFFFGRLHGFKTEKTYNFFLS